MFCKHSLFDLFQANYNFAFYAEVDSITGCRKHLCRNIFHIFQRCGLLYVMLSLLIYAPSVLIDCVCLHKNAHTSLYLLLILQDIAQFPFLVSWLPVQYSTVCHAHSWLRNWTYYVSCFLYLPILYVLITFAAMFHHLLSIA